LDETLPIRRDETAQQLEGQLQAWLVGGQETGHQGEREIERVLLERVERRFTSYDRILVTSEVRRQFELVLLQILSWKFR
jgi:hypothetical protein